MVLSNVASYFLLASYTSSVNPVCPSAEFVIDGAYFGLRHMFAVI